MSDPAADPNVLGLPPVDRVDALPTEALPGFALHLAALQARVAARMAAALAQQGDTKSQDDVFVDVEQAAQLLGMSPDWVYDHADQLPFTRRVGRRALRFSLQGIRKYQASRRST